MSKTRIIPLPRLLHNTQQLANRYARLRDCNGEAGTNCISCGVWYEFERLQGGHFVPTTHSATRFDERNINGQCVRCNKYLSGNGAPYLIAMEAKYGREVVDELMNAPRAYKWSRSELEELTQYYKRKIKELDGSSF